MRRIYEPTSPGDAAVAAQSSSAPDAPASAPPTPAAPRGAAPPPGTFPASSAPASTAIDQRPDAALKGLTRLGVVLEGIGADAAKCGLKQESLEAAVTKRLTDAGFRVVRDSDDESYLYVNINTVTASAGLCVSRYDVTLYSTCRCQTGAHGRTSVAAGGTAAQRWSCRRRSCSARGWRVEERARVRRPIHHTHSQRE